MQSHRDKHQPACFLAHVLINKLAVIVGYCDLLIEKVGEQDAECAKRLRSIHELAKSAAQTLSNHQCELSGLIRITEASKSLFVLGPL